MKWFGGMLSRSVGAPVPVGARVLWRGPTIWSAGDMPVRQVRGADGLRLAVFGPCGATGTELTRLVERAELGRIDAAVTAWSGAYTLVLDDGRGALTVWADPAGAAPVYLSRAGNNLVWGSSSLALASLVGAGPDTAWLAAHLADPTAWVPGRSAWTGVEQLPPGHRWTVAEHGTSAITPFWRGLRLAWSDAVHRLRDDLADGVAIRVTDRMASSDLSGGLDSTTLAVLASKCGPVVGLTYHPKGREEGGDLDHARTVARAFPRIRHRLMALGPEHLPFTDLGALPLTDEPAPSAITAAQLLAQFRYLVSDGVAVHLTGDGGDSLFMPPPAHLVDLARSGRLLRLARDAQTWARLYRTSPWKAVASVVGDHGGTAVPMPWLTTNTLDLAASATAPHSYTGGLGHADRLLLQEARYVGRTAATENQLAAVHGIAMHNPFTDTRVVESVLAAPAADRWSARRYKPMLSDAVAGLLPPSVLGRGAKGIFTADHHQGLRANQSAVLDLVDGHLAALGLLRPAALRSLLRNAALGVDVPWGLIEPVLGTELWLRAAESVTRAVRWEIPA
ncbi:asparagine synthase [Kitasatospora sp. NA04385]|uniref:albusnodin/ikarugamycin family macrolactam cyclase n=1 Tax=Kitasatospora sp. NA04385 TaxID=2742135 RepID=UPI00159091E6|nr:albusnodin/ikarugamycin family macrolactam cyclase [Kitasatospora sp. NA04385]QKW21107.1 asparagine synthase [Kitasatospora sp. NA04385]